MATMHYWTGSEIACGLRNPENSTEAPGWVRCKRCLPRAQKDERRWQAEDDAAEAKKAARAARLSTCAHGIRHPWQCDDCDAVADPTPTQGDNP